MPSTLRLECPTPIAPSTDSPSFVALADALMTASSPDAYRAAAEATWTQVDAIRTVPRITDEGGRQTAWAIKRALSALFCYFVNRDDARAEEAASLEGAWAKALARWSQRLALVDDTARTVARYLRWSSSFRHISVPTELALGAQYGVLRRYPCRHDPSMWSVGIVGTTSKVGDNTFTVDWRGGHHRHYHRVCLPQVFYLRLEAEAYIETPAGQAFAATLPLLEPDYEADSFTTQGDHKYAARPAALRRSERERVLALVPHLR